MRRSIRWRLPLSLMLGVMLSMGAALPTPEAAQPKQATFEITNTFTVTVPKQAQTLRIWFAVPQDDAASRSTPRRRDRTRPPPTASRRSTTTTPCRSTPPPTAL